MSWTEPSFLITFTSLDTTLLPLNNVDTVSVADTTLTLLKIYPTQNPAYSPVDSRCMFDDESCWDSLLDDLYPEYPIPDSPARWRTPTPPTEEAEETNFGEKEPTEHVTDHTFGDSTTPVPAVRITVTEDRPYTRQINIGGAEFDLRLRLREIDDEYEALYGEPPSREESTVPDSEAVPSLPIPIFASTFPTYHSTLAERARTDIDGINYCHGLRHIRAPLYNFRPEHRQFFFLSHYFEDGEVEPRSCAIQPCPHRRSSERRSLLYAPPGSFLYPPRSITPDPAPIYPEPNEEPTPRYEQQESCPSLEEFDRARDNDWCGLLVEQREEIDETFDRIWNDDEALDAWLDAPLHHF
ncbi:uncharacterized protein BXZ73DRAFT_100986 [Epithele typhae]|uniref:uncharacterized protein n=1 Tax=Epithele typhae TaxID=378194 RepID=UPI0020084DD6|nr:uncharacterized protein BXZ73DRAFT_100986 [Epithele typhae]KAH9933604.1 hypothetical protein BXZ73DRAFT_100986 [Epithele typhae]